MPMRWAELMRPFKRAASGVLRPKPTCGGAAEAEGGCEKGRKQYVRARVVRVRSLQRRTVAHADAAAADVTGIVYDVLRSPGQPPEFETREFFEQRFAHDFSRVREHMDAKAGESARALNALALAMGSDGVIGAHLYAPTTSQGQELLAHDLTDVVQQRRVISRTRAEWARPRRTPALRLGQMPFDPGQSGSRKLGTGMVRAIGMGIKP